MAAMKISAKTSQLKLVLLFSILLVSACSTYQDDTKLGHPNNNSFIPQGMLTFEGSVFVASTNPSPGRWQLAGWQIASRSMAISDNQVLSDCTLYPHIGVEDQWIGSCAGNTLIPEDGASHIAVMHTPPNGNTVLVQVAPTPDK
jgi:hypothetical protein